MAELLLKNNYDVELKDDNGFTAFLLACSYGHLELMEMLLKFKANPFATSNNGMNALHISAALQNNPKVIEMLLKLGIPIDSRDSWLRTPFHLACENENINMIFVFKTLGADENLMDIRGRTPKYLASEFLKKFNRKPQ
jgi:ankyrin repeat protein